MTDGSDKACFVAVTAVFGLAGEKGKALFGAGGGNGNAFVKVVVIALVTRIGSFARGGCHIGGDLRAKEQKCKLGVVNKNVTGACDGLNRVIATKLPGINGIFFHPFKQNVKTLHNAGRAPSGILTVAVYVAPANVDVQEDTGYVAAYVVLVV